MNGEDVAAGDAGTAGAGGVGGGDYLSGLGLELRARLHAVNELGLRRLHEYVEAGRAVAFLGAGASAPLYPLWTPLIVELVEEAVLRGLPDPAAETCRARAAVQPDSVVELLRRQLGADRFRGVLREVFRARRDPASGWTWTPVHELVCRTRFAGVVTTNYDSGIVDARMRVRPHALSTGFASWADELALDRWLTGDVFTEGEDELPVLFAHGYHTRPDDIVLATTEYRKAYAGKLAVVVADLVRSMHLVWVGFSFADARISAILREVAARTGTHADPGGEPRHVAVMPWDPRTADAAEPEDPETLRTLASIDYGADLVLYPAAGVDHTALHHLLASITDARHPAVPAAPIFVPEDAQADPPTPVTPRPGSAIGSVDVGVVAGPAALVRTTRDTARSGVDDTAAQSGRGAGLVARGALPVGWVPDLEVVAGFTGRVDELARLDRWARDPGVRLVGVSAWGGAGKTALVGEWVHRGGPQARNGLRGVFGWDFYADPSADHWVEGLSAWAQRELGVVPVGVRPADVVLSLLRNVPVTLVLDGLEVVQEGPGGELPGGGFGRFLDGVLREVLTGACRAEHSGLVVLTSRFPFADLEGFDGGVARMLEVPPFTPAEGAALLAALGADWVDEQTRRSLSEDVHGHALAVAALAGVLAGPDPDVDVAGMRTELVAAGRADARVARVLRFYADRLSERDRWLVAAVSLFAHPVGVDALRAVAGHEAFAGRLDNLTEAALQSAVTGALAGLLSWHHDGTASAHPLVRAAFRPLAMGAADVAAEATLTGVPGEITSREEGLWVVEAIELLLDADEWSAADDLYNARTRGGQKWRWLPAPRLGQRAASAFVATSKRRATSPLRYLNEVGIHATNAGDLATGVEYLQLSIDHLRAGTDNSRNLSITLNNLAVALEYAGRLDQARRTAEEGLTLARQTGDRSVETNLLSTLGRVAYEAGNTIVAEDAFIAADRIEYRDDPDDDHLYSARGAHWAEFLARTGRIVPARRLTHRNRQISGDRGWNENRARCDRVLARLALADTPDEARRRAAAAVGVFRVGEYLIELAATLPLLADAARACNDLDAAFWHADEAVDLAGPRGIVVGHAAALTARARIHIAHATTEPTRLGRARDDADAALRLATRHGLAWHELDALHAHADVDNLDHNYAGATDWTRKAQALSRRLIPPGLDPDPLATIEHETADKSETEQG